MLFSNISSLLKKGVSLQLLLSEQDGKIEVTILPDARSGAGAGLVAKTVSGSPEELDAGFAGFMQGYAQVNGKLQDALTAVQAEAQSAEEAARTAAKAKVASAPKKKSAPTSVSNGALGLTSESNSADDESDGDGSDGASPGGDDISFGASTPASAAGTASAPFVL